MLTTKESPALGVAKESEIARSSPEPAALATGGIAALLTGLCCVVPLVLASIGLGGAWLANLRLLEPYRPVFIGIALAALGFAWWRIYWRKVDCTPGDVCAVPRVRRAYFLDGGGATGRDAWISLCCRGAYLGEAHEHTLPTAHRRLRRGHDALDGRVCGSEDRQTRGLGHDVKLLRDLREEVIDQDRRGLESGREPGKGRSRGHLR